MVNIVINPKYKQLEDFVRNLPDTFDHTGETVYDGRNTIKVFDIQGLEVNVKSFKKPNIINQVVYATFRQSKARRSFEYALRLEEKGFRTPAPIAYIEQGKAGLFKNSFYISINEHIDGELRELKTGTFVDNEELLRQFAHYTAHLHEAQVLHLDYSSGNILYKIVEGKYIFYLVDLNRMEFDKPISMDTACFNFRRLWGSDEMIRLFVQQYAESRNFDVASCLSRTFYYRKRFWSNFKRKHPGASPYEANGVL
ncbi:hypothetical protein D0T84_03235 [Dysgonomonas sp. 521]|uniref:lipopolysaccharide kinase InaA family protein n=1 Tax=Dysgonomonas sp. 521 TaxID=2302932 RepID=UPI0013D88F3A|nr:lipopolysaccharide kinase InaA family protein [Dysgonomonas sp. 521]NDV93932.1 hypothetical protein [Dysgonomonas sp. 521]